MRKPLRIALIVACLTGIVLSCFSLQSHYSQSKTSYCSLDSTFDCDVVNRSIYSEVHGVPVALIGLLGYLFMLGLVLLADRKWAVRTLLVSAAGGLCYALYLAYIEKYILATWCLLCLGSLFTVATITVLSAFGQRQRS
jgi:uncharacterized membrane protein